MGAGLFGAALCGVRAMAQEKRPTAREVVTAIQEHIGVPWVSKTVDTFKSGNPETPVTGIAVTMMATLDVLQRATANGQNLIITHEPTFFNHYDDKSAGPTSWAGRNFRIQRIRICTRCRRPRCASWQRTWRSGWTRRYCAWWEI